MAWRDHLLRRLARGLRTASGRAPRTQTINRVLDRIESDPELRARLEALDEEGVCAEFLALYASEEGSDR